MSPSFESPAPICYLLRTSLPGPVARGRVSGSSLPASEGPAGFPPPVTDPRNRYRFWRAAEVQQWFAEHYGDQSVYPDADVVAAINAGLELRRTTGGMLRAGT